MILLSFMYLCRIEKQFHNLNFAWQVLENGLEGLGWAFGGPIMH